MSVFDAADGDDVENRWVMMERRKIKKRQSEKLKEETVGTGGGDGDS